MGHLSGPCQGGDHADSPGSWAIVRVSLSGFFPAFAARYPILAGVRNRPGVTPTSRLKCWQNWLWSENPACAATCGRRKREGEQYRRRGRAEERDRTEERADVISGQTFQRLADQSQATAGRQDYWPVDHQVVRRPVVRFGVIDRRSQKAM